VFGIPVTSLDFIAVVFAIILGVAQGIFAVKLFYELVIKRIRIMAEGTEKSITAVRGG
jgi:predicted RND superfamily exporter protein